MNKDTARKILGNQPKYALRNMSRALQMLPWRNDAADWQRLRALKALGYRVKIDIPELTEG